MANWLKIPTLLLFLHFLVLVSIAWATFPKMEIAANSASDLTNPTYLNIQQLAKEKNFAEALKTINLYLEKKPKQDTANFIKAFLLNELGEYKKGLNILNQAKKLNPNHSALDYAFCIFYRNFGEVKSAIQSCKDSVESHKDSAQAHYEFAITLAAKGEMKKANAELSIATNLDPDNSDYFYQQGMNFVYLNESNSAEKAFKKAIQLNPEDQESAYQLGYLFAIQNKLDLAKLTLDNIWQNFRSHPKAEAARSLIELIEQDRLNQIPKKIIPSQYHLGRSKNFYKNGKYGLSLFEIQTAASLKKDDPIIREILIGMSSLFLRLNLTENSVRNLINQSKNNRDLQAKGYQELGDIYIMRGKLKKAKEFYELSQSLGDPDQLAKMSLEEIPSKPQADKPIQDPEELFFYPVTALNQKGKIFANYGMFKRALAIYSAVLQIDPSNLDSRLNTSNVYYQTQQYTRAISLLERTLISQPDQKNQVPLYILLAKCYSKKEDKDGAVKYLSIIKRINPEILKSLSKDPTFSLVKNHKVFN